MAIFDIKLKELEYIKKCTGCNPVLLLDDIFSEFDPKRRDHLAKLILKYQSVITTTEKEHVPEKLLKGANIIEIE